MQKGLIGFLRSEAPDVLCLQETKAFRDQCKEMWPEMIRYESEWHSAEKPGYSGVASFFKKTPLDTKRGLTKNFDDREGRVLLHDFSDFFLINVYVINGAASEARHDFKMKFLADFLNFLKTLDKKKPLIICGDINIAHRAVDIHDPVRLDGASGFKPEERAWMDDLEAAGFRDAFRVLHPEARDTYSWWSYRAGARQRNKGWRIDYFWLSDRISDRVRRLEMQKDVLGSDHCPLILDLA